VATLSVARDQMVDDELSSFLEWEKVQQQIFGDLCWLSPAKHRKASDHAVQATLL
jgi:hypothetical protein